MRKSTRSPISRTEQERDILEGDVAIHEGLCLSIEKTSVGVKSEDDEFQGKGDKRSDTHMLMVCKMDGR